MNLNTNISTTITSSTNLSPKTLKNGGRINKIKILTSISLAGINTVTGEINGQFIHHQNSSTLEINLNPNDNNQIELDLKGFCVVVIEKFVQKVDLSGNAEIKPISLKVD